MIGGLVKRAYPHKTRKNQKKRKLKKKMENYHLPPRLIQLVVHLLQVVLEPDIMEEALEVMEDEIMDIMEEVVHIKRN